MQNLLVTYIPKREDLRSEAIIDRLIVPRTAKKMFTDRAFSVAGPNYGTVCRMISSSKKTSNISQRALRLTYLN